MTLTAQKPETPVSVEVIHHDDATRKNIPADD
jgi:hypothetical protein